MAHEPRGEQGHNGEQGEEHGRGARDGGVAPLPLGLDAVDNVANRPYRGAAQKGSDPP